MNNEIPYRTRKQVIELWMQGIIRDEIARRLGIGPTSVTNIVRDWEEEIGRADAEAIRELAIEARKNGTTVPDCMTGARIKAVMKYLGIVDDQHIHDVLEGIVKAVGDKATPREIARAILEMLVVSKQTGTPLTEAPAHVQQIQEQMKQAEEQFQKQKDRITKETEDLNRRRTAAEDEAKKAEEKRNLELRLNNATLPKITEYRHANEELVNNGLDMDDPQKAVPVLKKIKEYGSAEKIIEKLRNIESLEEREKKLQTSVNDLQNRNDTLEKDVAKKTKEIEFVVDRLGELRSLAQSMEENIRIVRDNGIQTMRQMSKECMDSMKSGTKEVVESVRSLIADVHVSIDELHKKEEASQAYLEMVNKVKELEPFLNRLAGKKVPDFDFYAACGALVRVIVESLPPQYRIKVDSSLENAIKEYLWSIHKTATT